MPFQRPWQGYPKLSCMYACAVATPGWFNERVNAQQTKWIVNFITSYAHSWTPGLDLALGRKAPAQWLVQTYWCAQMMLENGFVTTGTDHCSNLCICNSVLAVTCCTQPHDWALNHEWSSYLCCMHVHEPLPTPSCMSLILVVFDWLVVYRSV